MLNDLQATPPDKILALMSAYRADTRAHKIDLGVGVYKNDSGLTPIFESVKAAEEALLEQQVTKSYVGMAGNVGFNAAMIQLIFGATNERLDAVQTPGGCGALRLIAELIQVARPGATIWVSDPTWPNHVPILTAAGLRIETYPYFDAVSGDVRSEAMLECLAKVKAGDVVLLHACCHNPTGANLSADDWQALAQIAAQQGWIPFFDIAYQGFGDGLDVDAQGIRIFADVVEELLVAASCSKNFGLYCERVGIAIAMGASGQAAQVATANMKTLARGNYSMPPDHGASIVEYILDDADARLSWSTELESMRLRMIDNRERFARAMRERLAREQFDFIADHRGMFSLLGLSDQQVDELRESHAVYMIGGGGRINVAGLIESVTDPLADAICAVL